MLNRIKQNIYPISQISLLFLIYLTSLYFNGLGLNPLLLPMIVGLLFIAILINILSKDFKWRKTKLHYVMLLYGFYLLIAPYFHNASDISRLTAWVLGLTPLSYFAMATLQMSKFKIFQKPIKTSYFLIGAFLATLGMLNYLSTQSISSAIIIDSNAYAGGIITFLLPLMAFYFLRDKHKSTLGLLSLLLVFLLSFALFATYSRSGITAFIIVSVCFLLVLIRAGKFFPKDFLVLVVFLVISYSAVKFYPDKTISREISVQKVQEDDSYNDRLLMWNDTLNAWKDSGDYLTGTGFGSFKSHYLERRTQVDSFSSGNYAHNDYIQLLLEGGLIQVLFKAVISGFVIYYLLFYYLRLNRKIENTQIVVILTLLLAASALFLQALLNFVFYVAPLAIFIGAALGIASNSKASEGVMFTNKIKTSICVLMGVSFIFLCIDIHLRLNYFVSNVNLEDSKYSALYQRANKLRVLRPMSFSLSRYQSIYLFKNVDKYGNQANANVIKDAYERETIRTLKLNKRDAVTFSYLATYAHAFPDRYQAMRLVSNELKDISNSKELFKKSIQYDPTIMLNYTLLAELVSEQEYQAFYELAKEKLHRRYILHGKSTQSKTQILDLLIHFSDSLGICQDLPMFEEDKRIAMRKSNQLYKETELKNCPATKVTN